MAVTRTARGTAQSKTSGTTLSIAAQSLNARDLLVVFLAYDDVPLTSVFWGTQQLTLGDAVLGNGVRVRLAWCEADATASRAITATFESAIVAKAMVAESFRSSVLTAGLVWNADQNATNVGLGTAASTPTTAPIVGGTESVRVGVVGTEGPSGDTAGTWVQPSVAGQRIGTTGNPAASNVTASSAYNLAPAAGSTTALSKTGMTSRDWGAGIRSFYWAVPPAAPVNLQANADGSSSGDAALAVAVPLQANADGSSSGVASLSVAVPLAALADGSSSGVAQLTAEIVANLAAVADGTSSGVASLEISVPLAALADGASSGIAALALALELQAAAADGSSAGVATLEALLELQAAADGSSEATAALELLVPLQAAADGASSGTASLEVVEVVELLAIAEGSSSGTALLELGLELGAGADGSSSGVASLDLAIELAAAADGTSSAIAALAVEGEAPLAGIAEGSSSATASLEVAVELFAAADGSSSGAAVLEAFLELEISGSAEGSSAAEAALLVEISLFASANGSSSAIVTFATGFGTLVAGVPTAVGMQGGTVSTAGTVISRAEGPEISSHAEPG